MQQFIPQRKNRFKCANWYQACRQSRRIASELTWYTIPPISKGSIFFPHDLGIQDTVLISGA